MYNLIVCFGLKAPLFLKNLITFYQKPSLIEEVFKHHLNSCRGKLLVYIIQLFRKLKRAEDYLQIYNPCVKIKPLIRSTLQTSNG